MSDETTARLKTMGVPLRFHSKHLENYDFEGHPGRTEAVDWASDFAQDYATSSKSAVLLGRPGTGKTHLAIGIMAEALRDPPKRLFREQTASYIYIEASYYAKVGEIVQRVKSSWGKGAGETETEIRSALTTPRLLVLDEVGIQFGTDFEKNFLFEILNDRYENMKPTILISNLKEADVKGYIGERILDRLREDGGEFKVFDWESYR